jgi:hypothetical protein
MNPDISVLVAALLRALDIHIACGQITLNVNQGTVQSIETKTHVRLVSARQLTAEPCLRHSKHLTT